jgi:hypothetical protein
VISSFKNIMNKKATDSEGISERDKEILAFDKISSGWNLETIQEYLRGKNTTNELSDIGMASLLLRFINQRKDDKKMESGQRREFETIDRVERTKKGLDAVILIANQSILSTATIPLIELFITTYLDVIQDLDKKLSQTYEHKMKSAHKNAEVNALAKSQFKRELHIKYDK